MCINRSARLEIAFEDVNCLHVERAQHFQLYLLRCAANTLKIQRLEILPDTSNRQVRRERAFFREVTQLNRRSFDILAEGFQVRGGFETDPDHACLPRVRECSKSAHG